MSKWLRRGFGHHNNHSNSNFQDSQQQPDQTDFSPPAPPAAESQPQNMVGYGSTPSPATVAMDVDGSGQRNKYSQPPYPSGTSSKAYDHSRSGRPEEGRSRRTSRSDRSRSMQAAGYGGGGGGYQRGATHASSSSHMQQNAFAPPQQTSITPPIESGQPAFPPPAVTSDSETMGQPAMDASQRRPAYLLHRDLVIGKGSYGQVCIASRGESEGHSAGRSGKRKKFACKCVMLRNDPKYIAKLQEEVNVLRELRGHDNVIRLFDVFCVDNELFIITELGRGGDLFHLLTTHPKHGVTEAYAGKFRRRGCDARCVLFSPSISSQNGCRNAFGRGVPSRAQHLPP